MRAVERIVRRLPGPLNAAVKSVRHAVDPLAVGYWRWRTKDREPLPPSYLRARTGSGSSIAVWRASSTANAAELEAAVQSSAGRKLDDFDAILDWGCGSGRVLARLVEFVHPATGLVGSDVDHGAIAWARRHHPDLRWEVNGYHPPLPFAQGEFDLLYSISILTHLDEYLQLAWLAELARVLRPGGLALLSVHGEYAYAECASGRVISKSGTCARRIAAHRSLAHEGFIFEGYDVTRWNRRGFVGIDGEFGMAFHSCDYIRSRWTERFEVVDILPRALGSWQDLIVLRNR